MMESKNVADKKEAWNQYFYRPEIADEKCSTDPQKIYSKYDPVIINEGAYKGQTGIILSIKSNHLIVSPVSKPQKLKYTRDNLRPFKRLKNSIEWGDLVLFTNTKPREFEIGIVMYRKGNNVNILSPNYLIEKTVDKLLKVDKKNRLKSETNKFRKYDVVYAIDGKNIGRRGRVHKVYGNYVFIFSTACLDRGFFFICEAEELIIEFDCSNIDKEDEKEVTNESAGNVSDIVGKCVMITEGSYRGYTAMVEHEYGEKIFQVQLMTTGKKVMVPKTKVVNVCANFAKLS